MIFLSLVGTICDHAYRCLGRSVLRLHWRAEGGWELETRQGDVLATARLAASYVHPQLVVLSFRVGKWYWRAVILLPDALDPTQFRQPRVRLRLAGSNAASPHR